MLMIENLFDLTHASFLHGKNGDLEKIIQAPLQISKTDEPTTAIGQMRSLWSKHHQVSFGEEIVSRA